MLSLIVPPIRRKNVNTIATHRGPKIIPFLWFDAQAELAANFYISVFKNSRILTVARYGDAGPGPKGSVMTISFEIEGQEFVALNGGPHFTFNQAVSFVVHCDSQEEIDEYWTKLAEGGRKLQCGWVTDKFGVPWQIVPRILAELVSDPDLVKSQRAMKAMLQMEKLDIAALQAAHAG